MATSENRDSHHQQQASATRFSDSEATSFWAIRDCFYHPTFFENMIPMKMPDLVICIHFAHEKTHILLAPKKNRPSFLGGSS